MLRRRLTTVLLTLLVVTVGLFGQAGPKGKSSSYGLKIKMEAALEDLHKRMLSEKDEPPVIIQFAEEPGRDGDTEEAHAKRAKKRAQDVAALGGVSDQSYWNFPMVRGRMNRQALENLSNHASVTRISLDYHVLGSLYTTARAVGADQVWSGQATGSNLTGSGITVAVIDSGIDRSIDLPSTKFSKDVTYSGTSIGDDFGHGTHVAGIIAASGVNASMAGLYPVQSRPGGARQ